MKNSLKTVDILAITLLFLATSGSFARAATLHVGDCMDCTYVSIKQAIIDSDPGGTVVVHPGEYNEQIGTPVGFTHITVESTDGPENTIIDFQRVTPMTGGHVVQMGCACGTCALCPTKLDGFTIRGGNSSSSAGGVEIMGGDIRNCIIEGNKGKVGGGIRVVGGGGTVNIFNTLVQGNFAEFGGGIGFLAGDPAFIEISTIKNNFATKGNGGGISVSAREITIDGDTEISGNLAENSTGSARGGGIYMLGAAVNLINSNIVNNEANGLTQAQGGGVYLSGFLFLDDAQISDNNRAIGAQSGHGGGIYCTGLLENGTSFIGGNAATTDGDNIYIAPNTNCSVQIPHLSQQNYDSSGEDGDPVNTFTGELFTNGTVDLNLGGPLPLFFERHYASGLLAAGVTGRLGNNWLHNFEWSMSSDATSAVITTNQGRNIEFEKPGADWVLTRQTDISYQLVESGPDFVLGDPRNAMMYTFDDTGKLLSIEDGKGSIHTLSYTGPDLISVSDTIGRTLSLTYGGDTYLDTVSDGQRTILFAHTGDNLTSTIDARSNETTYAYAAGGLMTSMTRPEGNTPFSQT